MKESENIRDFFSRVSIIINQIQCLGDTIQDKKVVEKILRSLPPKFDHCVAAIEESKDLSKLSTFELMSSLQAHEQRINRSTNQSVDQAFQSKLKFSENDSSKLDFKKEYFKRRIITMEEIKKGAHSTTMVKEINVALFAKRIIILHKIATSDVGDVESLITRKGIVDIKRIMKQKGLILQKRRRKTKLSILA